MSERILVIGEALIDRVRDIDGDVVEHPGGSPANVAVGLARLDHLVDFATRIGQDERGARIANHLTRHGVSLLEVSVGPNPTSVAEAHLDPSGAAEYTFDLHWDLPRVSVPARVSHVHTGSIAAVLEPGAASVLATLRAARAHATISYDPNLRPDIMGDLDAVRPRVEEIVGLADVVKASDEDLALIYPGQSVPEVLRRWAKLGPSLVVVTRAQRARCSASASPASWPRPPRWPATSSTRWAPGTRSWPACSRSGRRRADGYRGARAPRHRVVG